ncbi:MAG: sensor histidine kinase [Actinobacteria bacterium]|nr:sensor histidine kinase [Actinomycetota bacterium]
MAQSGTRDGGDLTRYGWLSYRNRRDDSLVLPCPFPELADLIAEQSGPLARRIKERLGGPADEGHKGGSADDDGGQLLEYLGTLSESLRSGSLEPFQAYQLVQAQRYLGEGIPLEEVEKRAACIRESLRDVLLESAASPDQILSFTLFSGVLETFIDASSMLVAIYYVQEREAALVEKEAQLERLSRRLLTVQEEERRRLANDIHDELIQLLFGLRYELDIVRGKLDEGHGVEDELSRMKGRIDQGLTELRRILRNLRPALLDDLGLVSALKLLVRQVNESAGIRASLDAGNDVERLPTEIEICLYRVAQEALTNAVKHSGAGFISLSLLAEDGHIRLEISDDGTGFDTAEHIWSSPGRSGERLGLFGMRERVRGLDGSLSIDSEPGGGTRVSAVLPLAAHD